MVQFSFYLIRFDWNYCITDMDILIFSFILLCGAVYSDLRPFSLLWFFPHLLHFGRFCSISFLCHLIHFVIKMMVPSGSRSTFLPRRWTFILHNIRLIWFCLPFAQFLKLVHSYTERLCFFFYLNLPNVYWLNLLFDKNRNLTVFQTDVKTMSESLSVYAWQMMTMIS